MQTTKEQPQVPSDIINAITQYGDARADDGLASGPALANAITRIRAALASHDGAGIADPYPTVPVPQDADMAQLMLNMGLMWLQGNAPERLTEIGRAAVPAQPTQPQPEVCGTCDGYGVCGYGPDQYWDCSECIAQDPAAQPQQVEGAAPTISDGYKRVPIEPTNEMLHQAYLTENCGHGARHFANAYRAMLAAAPNESTLSPEPAKVGGE